MEINYYYQYIGEDNEILTKGMFYWVQGKEDQHNIILITDDSPEEIILENNVNLKFIEDNFIIE